MKIPVNIWSKVFFEKKKRRGFWKFIKKDICLSFMRKSVYRAIIYPAYSIGELIRALFSIEFRVFPIFQPSHWKQRSLKRLSSCLTSTRRNFPRLSASSETRLVEGSSLNILNCNVDVCEFWFLTCFNCLQQLYQCNTREKYSKFNCWFF